MPIKSRSLFADNCAQQALYFGINLHYLLVAAEVRSGIQDKTVGNAIGPFAYDEATWLSECSDLALEVVLDNAERSVWRSQCIGAALSGARAMRAFIDRESRYPNLSELYQEHWKAPAPNQATLDAARAATAALVDPAILNVTGANPAATPVVPSTGDALAPTVEERPGPEVGKSEELFVFKARWIMERLIDDFNLRDFQAAGILGNIGHECGGFHQFQEVLRAGAPGRGGFGWCQWTGPRRKSFEAYCASEGVGPTTDGANYGYLRDELKDGYASVIADLKKTVTLPSAVRVFENGFEKATVKNWPSRERWATLALAPFRRTLPPGLARDLNLDTQLSVLDQTTFAGTKYWIIGETAEDGDQILVSQALGELPRILKQDTTVFPLTGLGLPSKVVADLSRNSEAPPDDPPSQPANGGVNRAESVLAEAKACNRTLVTRSVPGTKRGALACAWAVNEIVRRALGAPIGGGLSTATMAKVLAAKHQRLTPAEVIPGTLVISPTKGRTGHVGIIGDIAPHRGDTVIYSNSSSRGLFFDYYTLDKWRTYYVGRQKLDMFFYEI